MCIIKQTKPFSTSTIQNMFSVRKITVYAIATMFALCLNSSVHANSRPLSLIGDEPVQPQQPVAPPPPPPVLRSRPQSRRRPRPRPGPPACKGATCLLCKGHDMAVDLKFKNKQYVQQQLDCVLNRGECDETGQMVKRLAPEVLRGLCPSPCNMCTQRQIKRIMAVVSREYPEQWSEMLRTFSGRS